MTHSKPKPATLVSIGIFLIIILATDAWLLMEMIQHPANYFILKLILVSTLLVIAIIVGSKSYLSAVTISLGDNKITYRHLLGNQKSHKISQISDWKEEIISRKNSDYRKLTIVLSTGKKLSASNHENSNYNELINYLKKKVKSKKR